MFLKKPKQPAEDAATAHGSTSYHKLLESANKIGIDMYKIYKMYRSNYVGPVSEECLPAIKDNAYTQNAH